MSGFRNKIFKILYYATFRLKSSLLQDQNQSISIIVHISQGKFYFKLSKLFLDEFAYRNFCRPFWKFFSLVLKLESAKYNQFIVSKKKYKLLTLEHILCDLMFLNYCGDQNLESHPEKILLAWKWFFHTFQTYQTL